MRRRKDESRGAQGRDDDAGSVHSSNLTRAAAHSGARHSDGPPPGRGTHEADSGGSGVGPEAFSESESLTDAPADLGVTAAAGASPLALASQSSTTALLQLPRGRADSDRVTAGAAAAADSGGRTTPDHPDVDAADIDVGVGGGGSKVQDPDPVVQVPRLYYSAPLFPCCPGRCSPANDLPLVDADFLDRLGIKHLRENPHVIGPRHRYNYTLWMCIKSVFAIHSETLNIWTHLMGCVMFVALAASVASVSWLLVVQAALYALAFALSSSAHTFAPHGSERWYRIRFGGDRIGIALMLGGANACVLAYSLRCFGPTAQRWGIAISYVSAIITAAQAWRNVDSVVKQVLNVVCFGVEIHLGMPGLILELRRDYELHKASDEGALHHTFTNLSSAMAPVFWNCVGAWVTAIFAGAFFVAYFPERLRPGSLAELFPGHALMHATAVVSCYFFLNADTAWSALPMTQCLPYELEGRVFD